MPSEFARLFGMSDAEVERQLAASPEVDRQLDAEMGRMVDVWKSNAPVDTGEYRESIRITERAKGGKGKLGATDPEANLIEDGTVDTPEFAPGQKMAARWGGSIDRT